MNMMKKMIIFLVLFLMISFSISIAAENNWELYQKLDHKFVYGESDAELWETIDSASFIETALVYNRVNLGGSVLKSYNRFAKNYEVDEHNKNDQYQEKNKKFYPFFKYTEIIYGGFDSNNNIRLRVYNNNINDRKKIYSEVNQDVNFAQKEASEKLLEEDMVRLKIMNMDKMKDVFIKTMLLMDESYLEFEKDYKEYIVSVDKVIIFDNNLIPNFKIKTNSDNSTIKIQIVD